MSLEAQSAKNADVRGARSLRMSAESVHRACEEAHREASAYNFGGAYAILRRAYDEALATIGCLPHAAAPGTPGGAGGLSQSTAAVSDVRNGGDRRSERADRGASAAVRIAEIRQDNEGGGVSYQDVKWLCSVADASARLVAAGRGSRELALRIRPPL